MVLLFEMLQSKIGKAEVQQAASIFGKAKKIKTTTKA